MFASRYFASRYFAAGFYRIAEAGAIAATLDVTEAADTLESAATVFTQPVFVTGLPRRRRRRPDEPRLRILRIDLDVTEAADTLEATVTLGFNPVELDNNLLLIAA